MQPEKTTPAGATPAAESPTCPTPAATGASAAVADATALDASKTAQLPALQGTPTDAPDTAPNTTAQEKPGKRPKRKRRRWYRHKDVNNGVPSFAAGLNYYSLFWVFLIACVIGVVWETLFIYAREGYWERTSGMLYGPFNQVYGMGAVLFVVALYRFRKKNGFIIFAASAMIGMGFEYVISWVQETVFGSTSWNYSDMSSSIGAGRTNWLYGIGWGVMGLLFITHFWPFVSEMIQRIPNKVGKPLTVVLTVVLACNLALSGMAVYRYGQRHEGVPATNVVATWLDATYPDQVMAEKYPKMQFGTQAPPQKAPAGSSASNSAG